MKEPNTEGYVLTINDEICGCCLLQLKKTKPMDNKELFVVENNGYLTRDYVFIKHRGNNLQQLMILKRIEILKQKDTKLQLHIFLLVILHHSTLIGNVHLKNV